MEDILIEEEWHKQNENLIEEWKNRFKELSKKHSKKAKDHKWWHIRVGLPKLIIPTVMTGISSAFASWEYIYLANFFGFAITTLLTAYYDFFAFSEMKEKNDQHAAAYFDMITTIEVEQSRKYKFREPVDRFIEKIQARYDNLVRTAPDL